MIVFGRIAGKNAAEYVKKHKESGGFNLDHVADFNSEVDKAKLEEDRISPMLLPDYSNPKVQEKQLTTDYHGTLV